MKAAELIQITLTADGGTRPHVPSGSEIVLVKKGKAMVGKLYYEQGIPGSIEIEHPLNEEMLSLVVTSFLKSSKPALLKGPDAKLATCPSEIKDLMVWNQQQAV